MSLDKYKVCFFIASFLAGKEANGAVAVDKPGQKIERGKNQRPGAGRKGRGKQGPASAAATGALRLSEEKISAPGQGEEEEENRGRHRQQPQAAHFNV